MTDNSSANAETLLTQALGGSPECLGNLLDLYRNYLKLLVVSQLERKLLARVSPSDVVQETFLEASRDFRQFRGATKNEFSAWLRQILVHNLKRVVEQHVLARKRDVRREVSLDTLTNSLEHSTARLDAILAASGHSPSGRLQQVELELELADALSALPEDYRQVIFLRHMEELPFEQVGSRMARSAGAARMLWLRAIQALRLSMEKTDNKAIVQCRKSDK